MVDVAKHRAVRANLEGTIVWLQNEAAGKPLYRATLFGSFFEGLHEGVSSDSLAAVNSLCQEAESKLLEMKEALELQVVGSDNLCLAVGLVLDDLGMEATTKPGQLVK